MTSAPYRPTRRTTLAWLAAAMASPLALQGAAAATAGWPAMTLPKITGAGYGTDPDIAAKKVTWPLTLTAPQRAMVNACADLILPPAPGQKAPSALAIDAFADEWLSAPYSRQLADRAAILPGLAWLDLEAKARFGQPFLSATDAGRRQIFDSIAWRDRVTPDLAQAAEFFARLRGLVILGYYTTPEGEAELGFAGNSAIAGVYPGPPPEALAHLKAQLAKLNLKMPA